MGEHPGVGSADVTAGRSGPGGVQIAHLSWKGLGRRGRSDAAVSTPTRHHLACRRVQSVSAHSSSSISPFSVLGAFAYRLAICLVTALRSAIESPPRPSSRPEQPRVQGAPFEDIFRRGNELVSRTFPVMQLAGFHPGTTRRKVGVTGAGPGGGGSGERWSPFPLRPSRHRWSDGRRSDERTTRTTPARLSRPASAIGPSATRSPTPLRGMPIAVVRIFAGGSARRRRWSSWPPGTARPIRRNDDM